MRTHHEGTSQNLPRIVNWVAAKKLNEYELAQRILAEFEKPALLDPLRGWIAQALQEVDALRRTDLEGQQIVNEALNEEKGKGNLTVQQYSSVSAMLNGVGNLSAKPCGDLIRVYGVVVEKAGEAYDKKLKAYRSQRQQFTPFDAGVTGPYGPQLAEQTGLRKYGKLAWSKKPEDMARARTEVKPHTYQPVTPGRAQQRFLNLGGGITAWTLRDESTVHKMDRVFGLPLGADISGTTTDTIAFLRHFVTAGVDPVYFLLPIATIVAAGHHTILEAGLALTQNWRMTGVQYRIGFFSTLLAPTAAGPGAANLRSILQQYEDDQRNRRLLLYYSAPERIGGCYEYALAADKEIFRGIALADAFLMMRCRLSFKTPWVTLEELENFERVGWPPR